MTKVSLTAKYRPKKLSEVIGQDVVVKSFTNAFQSSNMHHAYILAGIFGSGKTTTARIVAAMDNCDEGPTLEPCGKCQRCQEIFSGQSLGVREIDAASNRGIDDIRQLRNDIRQKDGFCRIRYVIIDEAHSLTGQAAEAALKMIEEPPENVRFILCTTEPQAIKDTIHSRCIMMKFNKVDWNTLYNHLKTIAEKESINYNDDALRIIAKSSKNSVRNALQNLQSVLNYVGTTGEVNEDSVKDVIYSVDDKLYNKLMLSVLDINIPSAIKIVNDLLKDGKEAFQITDGLYWYIRNIILVKTCPHLLLEIGFSDEEIKNYHQVAEKTGTTALINMSDLVEDINRGLKINVDPQPLIEKFVYKAIKVTHTKK